MFARRQSSFEGRKEKGGRPLFTITSGKKSRSVLWDNVGFVESQIVDFRDLDTLTQRIGLGDGFKVGKFSGIYCYRRKLIFLIARVSILL